MLRFISSIRLAVVLIAAIAGFCVSATLYDLPQMYQSWPFRLAVALFFVNLLTCTLKLLPGLLRTFQRRAADFASCLPALDEAMADETTLRYYFTKNHYAVDVCDIQEGTLLYAQKGRLSLLAPHMLHVGILIILVGAMLSSFAIKDQMQLAAGEAAALPSSIAAHTGPMSLRVSDFQTVYDKQGAIDNWVTTFSLQDAAGHEVKGVTKVNAPYKDHGLSIYQMAYANRYDVYMEGPTEDSTGDFVFPEDFKIPLPTKGSMMFSPMAKGIILLTVFDDKGQTVRQEAMHEGAQLSLEHGLKITYKKPISTTVLELKYSRAMSVVFFGFIVATIASMLFWLGRFRYVLVLVLPDGRCRFQVRAKGRELKRQVEDELHAL